MKGIRIPLILKLLLPLIGGVILAFYTSVIVPTSIIFIGLFILLALSIPVISKQFKLRAVFGLFTTLVFFLFGIYLVGIHTSRYNADYFAKSLDKTNNLTQIEIVEVPEEKANSVKCFAEVQSVNGQKTMGKTLLYFEKTPLSLDLAYGDIIYARVNFQAVKANGNPKEFDYARYLRIHDVVHQAYIKSGNWQYMANTGNPFLKWIFGVRHYLGDVLTEAGLSDNNLMVARALILGEKQSLDRETLRTFSSAGAMHVLAVSGLHVGIVMLIFSFLLKPLKRMPRGRFLFVMAVLMGIWFYALITGMSSSVLRASVMFSFVIVGQELERQNSVYQSIMVSAFILILFEPLVIFQVGFQLSYLAVLGIVYLQPKIYNLWYVKNTVLDKVWQISAVSIAAQLATFPLGLYYFHQFPNFFMISNLIVIPLAFAILLTGITYFVVNWIPVLSDFIFYLLDFLLSFLNAGVKWIEGLPYAIYWGVSIHWFEVFWLYAIILLAAIAFIGRKTKILLAGMALSVGLLVFNVWEKYGLAAENQLVIYNVNNSTAVDLFYGQKNIFIADSALLDDDDKLLFHVKHNWFYRSGNEDAYTVVPYTNEKGIINFHDRHVLFLSGEVEDSIPRTDYVYLRDVDFVPEKLISHFKTHQTILIMGTDLRYGLKSFLKKELPPEQIHDLKEEGAFVLNVEN